MLSSRAFDTHGSQSDGVRLRDYLNVIRGKYVACCMGSLIEAEHGNKTARSYQRTQKERETGSGNLLSHTKLSFGYLKGNEIKA